MVLGISDRQVKEKNLEDISSEADKPLTLQEIKNRVINTSYCPVDVVEQIREAATVDELNSLGYDFFDDHPTTAYDIFKFTKNEEGRQKVLDEKLVVSYDPMVLSYACLAIAEDEGAERLNKFGYDLISKSPKLACLVFYATEDKQGFEKSIAKIAETNENQAENLRKYYEFIESDGTEGRTRLAHFLAQNCVHRIIQKNYHKGHLKNN